MQQLFGRSFTKKPPFGHSKNGKWFFRPTKMKTSLGNIVCHSNMHPCAQYEIIWTNYAMNVAIRLIIWLESHWSPHVIAHFWEHFFKIIAVLQVYYFFLGTWPHIMTQCEGFPIFWFFLNFLCPFQNAVKTAGLTVPSQWLNLGKLLMFIWLNIYLCTYKWFLEKIKSKLWGSCSSNLTRFQLNRREFVFFTRGGSKLLKPKHLVNYALNMSYYFIKFIWSIFATIIW